MPSDAYIAYINGLMHERRNPIANTLEVFIACFGETITLTNADFISIGETPVRIII